MLWIGVTGPIGGGKSTVAALLKAAGYPVIDADEIVHRLMGPGGAAERPVFETFGWELKNAQGFLDRRALGQVVFEDPAKLDLLESILHPLVRREVANERERLERLGHTAAFYDVPLLFEKNMADFFDHILVVSASEPVRRERFKARTRLTDEEFNARSLRQLPAAEKEARADVLIRNEGTRADLRENLDKALQSMGVPDPSPTATKS